MARRDKDRDTGRPFTGGLRETKRTRDVLRSQNGTKAVRHPLDAIGGRFSIPKAPGLSMSELGGASPRRLTDPSYSERLRPAKTTISPSKGKQLLQRSARAISPSVSKMAKGSQLREKARLQPVASVSRNVSALARSLVDQASKIIPQKRTSRVAPVSQTKTGRLEPTRHGRAVPEHPSDSVKRDNRTGPTCKARPKPTEKKSRGGGASPKRDFVPWCEARRR